MRMSTERNGAMRRMICVRPFYRWRRNEDGATAIEFGAIAFPFFMFIFGLIGIALHFFIMNSIEKGMDQTSRLVRTGQAQKTNMTVKQFRDSVCDKAGYWIKCDKLKIFPDRAGSWAEVAGKLQPCVVNGAIKNSPANDSDLIAQYVGADSAIVFVMACYHWELPASIPFLKLGNFGTGNNKTMVMQAATAFRTEPYK
ncbi:MAG: TadE/TadG family type IV pilus assembly protein [Hyphomicrobium sp.]